MDDGVVLGIIAGSGVDGIAGMRCTHRAHEATPWGEPSAPVRCGHIEGVRALYLARHGEPHAIAPHRINYRANLQALHALGATHIVALAAVGGIAAGAQPGTLWLPEQLIDYSWGRESSFHDGTRLALAHAEFADPYDEALRARLARAAQVAGTALHAGGVYGCTQGPRLETAAEIRRLQRDGCDLVGMTGMPEAALARELDIPYATVALVVNRAAGLGSGAISLVEIHAVAAACAARIAQLLAELARGFGGESGTR